MADIVHIKTYEQPACNYREILRYAGAKGEQPELEKLIDDCLKELGTQLSFKVCYSEYPIRFTDNSIDLGFTVTDSRNLRKNLENCDSIVIFGATIGIGIDRLIARYSRLSPSKALMFQAIGAERIEALCDLFNGEITEKMSDIGKTTRPRFSPGYGDMPLDVQRDIFRVLDCPRKIGLTLNDSLLMSPTKSVTALIGVGNKN